MGIGETGVGEMGVGETGPNPGVMVGYWILNQEVLCSIVALCLVVFLSKTLTSQRTG